MGVVYATPDEQPGQVVTTNNDIYILTSDGVTHKIKSVPTNPVGGKVTTYTACTDTGAAVTLIKDDKGNVSANGVQTNLVGGKLKLPVATSAVVNASKNIVSQEIRSLCQNTSTLKNKMTKPKTTDTTFPDGKTETPPSMK